MPTIAKLAIHPVQTAKSIKGFFVIDNLEAQVAKLNQAKEAATAYWDAMNVKGQSKELAAQVEEMDGLDKETKELIVTSKSRAHAEEVLTNKIQVQTGAQKLLNNTISAGAKIVKAAGSIALSIAISYAISGIISWIDKLVNAEKKEKELAKERAEEAKQQLETQKQYVKDIGDITKEYEELGKVTNKTEEQKQALVDLQNQLVETFGKEAKGIDLVNGKYEDQISLLDEVNKKEAKDAYYSARDNRQNSLSKTTDNIRNDIKTTLYNEDYEAYEKIAAIDGVEKPSRVWWATGKGVQAEETPSEGFVVEEGLTSQGKARVFEEILKILSEDVSHKHFSEDWYVDLYSQIRSNYNHYKQEVDEYEKALREEAKYFIESFVDSNNNSIKELLSYEINSLNDYVEWKNILYDTFEEELLTNYTGDHESLLSVLEETVLLPVKSLYEGLNTVRIFDSIDEVIDEFSGDIDNLKTKVSEFDDYLEKIKSGSLTSAEEIELFKLYPELVGVDDLHSALTDLKENAVSKLVDEMSQIKVPEHLQDELDYLIEKIKSLSNAAETELSLSDFVDLIEKQYDKEINKTNEQISNLEKLRDKEASYYDEKISKLQEANEEQEKANELEEAYQELERARTQKTLKVWRSGVGWTWETDKSAIEEAKSTVTSLEQEKEISALEKSKEAVVSKYDAQIESLNEYKDKLEEHKSSYQTYVDDMNSKYEQERLNSMGLTLDLKGELDQRVADLEDYKEKVNLVLSGFFGDESSESTSNENTSNENTSNENTSSGKTLNLENTFSGKILNLGKEIVSSVLLSVDGIDGEKILKQQVHNNAWAWSKDSVNPFDITDKIIKTAVNYYNSFSFGNIIANNPTEFKREMNKYLKDNTTKSIIK